MVTCHDCGLYIDRSLCTDTQTALCGPCLSLHNLDPSIRVRPIEREDLELLLAWRSNPKIYQHFRLQDGPLDWNEHVTWYGSRSDKRYDFLIRYENRRVGVVSIDPDDEIGIYIGDFSAHGHGVAATTLEWICDRFEDRAPLTAEIHENNEPSKKLFKRCGFEKIAADDGWIQYIYES